MPSRLGMTMSVISRSKLSPSSASNACTPSSTEVTLWPRWASARLTKLLTAVSTSATRMRAVDCRSPADWPGEEVFTTDRAPLIWRGQIATGVVKQDLMAAVENAPRGDGRLLAAREGDAEILRALWRVPGLGLEGRGGAGVELAARRVERPLCNHGARRIGELGAQHRQRLLAVGDVGDTARTELQSLMRISYAVFCLKQKNNTTE